MKFCLLGRWSGPSPYCIPKLCAGPSQLGNGTLVIGTWTREPLPEPSINLLKDIIDSKRIEDRIYTIGTEFSQDMNLNSSNKDTVFYPVGSEIWFDCNPGFHLVGSSSNICQDSDSWQNSFPICREIQCGHVKPPINGKITVEGFKVKQHMYYTCNEGYQIVGDMIRTCLDSGEWSSIEPTCISRLCPEPDPIQNGFINGDYSLEYGSVVEYICDSGFNLIGGRERVCGHTGQWSGQAPACVNSNQSCLVPQLINSGYVTFDGNLEVGSIAWYDCNENYELIGQYERKCFSNSSWSGDEPICKPKHCYPIKYISHGTVIGKVFEYGSVLQFSCNDGYELRGTETVKCSEAGSWDAQPPVCEPLLCPFPDSPENGKVKGSAVRYEDSIVYECNEGYTLVGPQVRKCGSQGTWSGDEPYCANITCNNVPFIEHGISIVGMRIPGERARFKCNLGWKLSGTSYVTCSSDGKWVGELPECLPSTCTVGTINTNAILITKRQNEFQIGAGLEWQCSKGMKMEGSNITTCLPNGEWDLAYPECELIQCKDAYRLENGVIFGTRNKSDGLEVRFSCDNGFNKVLDSFIECQMDKKWKGHAPICSKYVCKNEFNTQAKVTFKPHRDTYIAEFECPAQHELIGDTKLYCQRDNQWSSYPPTCELRYCSAIHHAPKTIYQKEPAELGQTIKIQCEAGYKLTGSQFMTCGQNGKWQDTFPICYPQKCDFEKRIKNGDWTIIPSHFRKQLWTNYNNKHLKKNNAHTELLVGDKLEFTCDDGYDVKGNAEVLCHSDLTLSEDIPKCRKQHCKALPNIENGVVVMEGRYRSASAEYSCQRGK